jgi:hypothetical protein
LAHRLKFSDFPKRHSSSTNAHIATTPQYLSKSDARLIAGPNAKTKVVSFEETSIFIPLLVVPFIFVKKCWWVNVMFPQHERSGAQGFKFKRTIKYLQSQTSKTYNHSESIIQQQDDLPIGPLAVTAATHISPLSVSPLCSFSSWRHHLRL